jgi:hypothetical protein
LAFENNTTPSNVVSLTISGITECYLISNVTPTVIGPGLTVEGNYIDCETCIIDNPCPCYNYDIFYDCEIGTCTDPVYYIDCDGNPAQENPPGGTWACGYSGTVCSRVLPTSPCNLLNPGVMTFVKGGPCN